MNNLIKTERLLIRPTKPDDANFIYELLNCPKWIKYIGDRNIKTHSDAEEYIKFRMLPQLEKFGFSNNTVIRKSDNTKIGTCGIYVRENIEGVDIGYAFLPEFEGKGYAFEAAACIVNYAFNELNFKDLNAYTTIDNTSSQKLLKKLGFKEIGRFRFPEDPEELMHFHLSKLNWK